MRKLEEIYDEVVEECLKNNCQSYRAIAIVSMEKAIEEYRSYREDLEDSSKIEPKFSEQMKSIDKFSKQMKSIDKFSKQMKSIDSNMAQVINDKFWELLENPPEPNESLKRRRFMKRYPKEEDMNVEFWKYKIIVPDEETKEEMIKALKHIHDSDIDTDIILVNQLAHSYLDPSCSIIIQELLKDD